MAAYEKLANLAYRLNLKTVKGEIDWEETIADGVYQASFASYSIQISVQQSQQASGHDVKISVIGDTGSEIESFLDVDIESKWLRELGTDIDPYTMMYETYEVARRSAMGTEQAINAILSELEDDDEIPF